MKSITKFSIWSPGRKEAGRLEAKLECVVGYVQLSVNYVDDLQS